MLAWLAAFRGGGPRKSSVSTISPIHLPSQVASVPVAVFTILYREPETRLLPPPSVFGLKACLRPYPPENHFCKTSSVLSYLSQQPYFSTPCSLLYHVNHPSHSGSLPSLTSARAPTTSSSSRYSWSIKPTRRLPGPLTAEPSRAFSAAKLAGK